MEERQEEMGMTDMQYKDFLRGLINNLKHIKEAGVSPKAEEGLDELLERFQAALED